MTSQAQTPRQIDAPTYLTLTDAAAVVGQSVKTLRRRIAAGALPAYRFGPRAIRVRLDELQNSGQPMNLTTTRPGTRGVSRLA